MTQTDPDDPPPQGAPHAAHGAGREAEPRPDGEPAPPAQPEEPPIQDVPVYPEGDPPTTPETAIRVAAGPGEHEEPDEGEDDVDEDDLDPQAPHSPPDIGCDACGARVRP
jgi:hypothetical protein